MKVLLALAFFAVAGFAEDYPKPAALTPPQSLTWREAEAHLYWGIRSSPVAEELEKVRQLLDGRTDAQRAEVANLQKERAGHKSVLDMLTKKIQVASSDAEAAGKMLEKRKEIVSGYRATLEKIVGLYQGLLKDAGYASWAESKVGDEGEPVVLWAEKAKLQYKWEFNADGSSVLRPTSNGAPRKGNLLLSRVFPAGVTLPDKSVDVATVAAVDFTPAYYFDELGKFKNLALLVAMKTRSKTYIASQPELPMDAVRHILGVIFPAFVP